MTMVYKSCTMEISNLRLNTLKGLVGKMEEIGQLESLQQTMYVELHSVTILALFCHYSVAILPLFCGYPVAILSLFGHYSVAILLLFCRYSVAILLLFCHYFVTIRPLFMIYAHP